MAATGDGSALVQRLGLDTVGAPRHADERFAVCASNKSESKRSSFHAAQLRGQLPFPVNFRRVVLKASECASKTHDVDSLAAKP